MPTCRTTPRPAAIAHAAATATTAAARNHGCQRTSASNGRAGDRCSIVHSCHANATTSIGGSARVSTASIVRWVGSTTASSTAATATVSQTNAAGRP